MKLNFILFSILAVWTASSVAQTELSFVRQMPGIATAQNSAQLASSVSSPLIEINVTEGDFVKTGQLLAALDYRAAQAAYKAAASAASDTSQLDLANIDLEEQQAKLEKIRSAQKTGASNAAELEKTTNEYKRALAKKQLEKHKLQQAKLNENTLKFQLESFLLRAPFDGMVTDIRFTKGNLVEAGKPIINLVHHSVLQVNLNLPLALFGKLKQDESYELTASAPVSKLLKAKLKFVSPVVDSASQTFMAKFEISNHEFNLPSGFAVRLSDNQFAKLVSPTNQVLAKTEPKSTRNSTIAN